jgi:hypothetical protein
MNSPHQPTPPAGPLSEIEGGLYRRIVAALEAKPAYVLLFGIAALFVLSSVTTSAVGLVRGDRWLSVLGLVSFLASLIAVFVVINRVEEPHHAMQPAQNSVQVQLNQVRGRIEEPAPSLTVARKIECAGWATGLAPGLHLWLATEVNGLIWPKGSEIRVDSNDRWSKTIFEDGAITEFSVSLLVANAEAHDAMTKWLQAGQQAGNFERLSKVFGTERIDRVDGLSLLLNPQAPA